MYQQKSFPTFREWRALIFVSFFTALIFALAQAGLDYSEGITAAYFDAPWLPTIAWYSGSLIVSSLVLHRLKPHIDPWVLPLVGLLGGVSLMLMYRLPTPYWNEAIEGFSYATRNMWYVNYQLWSFIIGQVAMLVVVATPNLIGWLRDHRRVSIGIGLLLLIATAIIGTPAASGGARVSLDLGIISFQPSELIKLLLVIYLASYLDFVRWDFNRFTYRYGIPLPVVDYIFPMLIILGAAIVLLGAMSDLGAALILLGIFPALMFLGLKRRVFWSLLAIAAIFLTFAWGTMVLIRNYSTEHIGVTHEISVENVPLPDALSGRIELAVNRVKARVDTWSDPWQACSDSEEGCSSYQTLEGLYAVAAGGIWGAGAGLGHPEHIPFNFSDFVFVVIAEEWGLLGAGAVLIIYWFLIKRGIAIAHRQAEPFKILLAMGIVTIFTLQIFVIIGGTLNLLPLTGITVPFISFGRSSILVNFMMLGLLLKLSAKPAGVPLTQETGGNINRLSKIFFGLFALLMLSLIYWTLWMSPKLHPAFPTHDTLSNNPVAWQRQSIWLDRVTRGNIIAADGTTLVTNGSDGRVYQDLSLIHILGEIDQRGVGVNGLEQAYNETLLGQGRYDLKTILARQLNGTWQGNDLQLTINPQWQQAAHNALGGYNGSVVALDAKTGAVLAMVSHPLYNPNDTDTIQNDPNAPMLNRAVSGLYPPGSTFKTVIAALTLENNPAKAKTSFDFTNDNWYWQGNLLCHQQFIGGANIESCNSYLQEMTLSEGFAWSDNILFANLATDLGAENVWAGAEDFGFGKVMPFDVAVAQSQLTDDVNALKDPAQLAMTGFGQSEVLATPLQMALVAAAIDNNGKMPQPYIVSQSTKPDGTPLSVTRAKTWQQTISRGTARDMQKMMIGAVEDGWASTAAVNGLTIGGKTGTAEWAGSVDGSALPHSWFIGFAEMPNGQSVAIAVIAEEAGEGSAVAAPIASYIFGQMAY